MKEIQTSIDCVIFSFQTAKLKVLLIERKNDPQRGTMALPGDFLLPEQSLEENADRILKDITNLDHIFLEQIKAFGKTHRYPDVRVITIGYYALINIEKYKMRPGYTAERLAWSEIENLPELAFDHMEIVQTAVEILKRKVRYMPLGFNLLPELFTLSQLQTLYEAILQIPLNKRNFRNRINQMKLLIDSGLKQQDVAHKPAVLYRFDRDIYDKLVQDGFYFKL